MTSSAVIDAGARATATVLAKQEGVLAGTSVATSVFDIASSQGWRRALLAWLGVQLKRAEQAGDSETAARLKRRIELVSG